VDGASLPGGRKSDADFNGQLDAAIQSIYDASTNKIASRSS
jgi:hypothetical protein